jgi:preprotein translocase subunit SecG
MTPLLSTLLYIVFILSAIILVVVILLQEGKGGGLTGALGAEGQQTFGVGASGIHKFTGWTCAIFLLSAVGIHFLNRSESSSSVVQESVVPAGDATTPSGSTAPSGDGGAQSAPAGGSTEQSK